MNHRIFWSGLAWAIFGFTYIGHLINLIEFEQAVITMLAMLAVMVGWLHD